ncbi:MAG: hypothetical protein H8E66_22870 [Planctomycetes bacterium]|nr:hypothetical protein [Planctomycetota bacterium]
MDVTQSNPCTGCTIDQDCCTHLSGLRLTQLEFNRCFKQHTDQIVVEREGPLVVVSQQEGATCPNWQNDGCAVYDARPRECTLFPHTLYVQQHRDDSVSVHVHSDTQCPLKAQLRSSQQEAEQLAREFAEEAFGAATPIRVNHETILQLLRRRGRNLVSRVLDVLLK